MDDEKKTVLKCSQRMEGCPHYTSDYSIGFDVVSPRKGDRYKGQETRSHQLLFVLSGDIDFSYDNFLNRRLRVGQLFLVPQGAEAFGYARSNSKLLVLSFNNQIETLCERNRLLLYTCAVRHKSSSFKPLTITPVIKQFTLLMEEYISKELRCSYLHELKMKELFILLNVEYSEKELAEFFFPLVASNTDFKIRVAESYRHDLDVTRWAEEFGMSYSPFLRRFKKEFGEPVLVWMLKQKAKHIKLRLSIPSTTISDIIRDFNFTDTSHFCRFCRKHFDCTPRELIQTIRGDDLVI